ncbi:IS1380 family transposase, partial [Halomonas salipaludis]
MFLPEHDSRGPLAMGETLTTWSPSCNGSVRVELSGQRTTSDSGALLLREALDNSGVVEAL